MILELAAIQGFQSSISWFHKIENLFIFFKVLFLFLQ